MFLKIKDNIAHIIFIAASIILFVGFGYSEALISIGGGLVFLQLFFVNHFSSVRKAFSSNKTVLFFIAIFVFYLAGTLFTHTPKMANYELLRNVFWVLIPAGIALAPKLTPAKYWNLLLFFAVIITTSTIYTTFNFFFTQSNLLNFRQASFIRHSSLSIYTVFSGYIILLGNRSGEGLLPKIKKVPLYLWLTWLFLFLSVQKSLLGIVALLTSLIVFLVIEINKMKNSRKKRIMQAALIATILLPVLYVGHVVRNFYNTPNEQPTTSIKTALGNTYSFDFNDTMKENGEFVSWYVSKKELEEAWMNRFGSDIWEVESNGYPVYDIAIRYLTSKGLKKDASGVYALTDADYTNIRNGIPNHIYEDMKYSFYPRIYQTIWELDIYFQTGDPNNKSLSQRIEYFKAAFYIIKSHPWGIGVGNLKTSYDQAYESLHSVLEPKFRIEAHNQYLNYIIKFGLIGGVIVIALIILPLFIKRKQSNNLMVIFLFIVAAVCVGDNFLELHTGVTFFSFFYSLMLWHSPENKNNYLSNNSL